MQLSHESTSPAPSAPPKSKLKAPKGSPYRHEHNLPVKCEVGRSGRLFRLEREDLTGRNATAQQTFGRDCARIDCQRLIDEGRAPWALSVTYGGLWPDPKVARDNFNRLAELLRDLAENQTGSRLISFQVVIDFHRDGAAHMHAIAYPQRAGFSVSVGQLAELWARVISWDQGLENRSLPEVDAAVLATELDFVRWSLYLLASPEHEYRAADASIDGAATEVLDGGDRTVRDGRVGPAAGLAEGPAGDAHPVGNDGPVGAAKGPVVGLSQGPVETAAGDAHPVAGGGEQGVEGGSLSVHRERRSAQGWWKLDRSYPLETLMHPWVSCLVVLRPSDIDSIRSNYVKKALPRLRDNARRTNLLAWFNPDRHGVSAEQAFEAAIKLAVHEYEEPKPLVIPAEQPWPDDDVKVVAEPEQPSVSAPDEPRFKNRRQAEAWFEACRDADPDRVDFEYEQSDYELMVSWWEAEQAAVAAREMAEHDNDEPSVPFLGSEAELEAWWDQHRVIDDYEPDDDDYDER